MKNPIRLTGVRQNNLKNISVEFPPKKITVVTGLSGSGKSSLVFDTLYAEGQRRYVESLSTYTRQFLDKMPKPLIDKIENIPPSIALEQRNHVMGSRSTVATQTEILDYLRLLWAKAGQTICPDCKIVVEKPTSHAQVNWALGFLPGKKAAVLAPIPLGGAPEPSSTKKKTKKTKTKKATIDPTALLETLSGQGFSRIAILADQHSGEIETLDVAELETKTALQKALSNPKVRICAVVDRLKLSQEQAKESRARILEAIERSKQISGGVVVFADLTEGTLQEFDQRFACSNCKREFKPPEPNLFASNSPIGACPSCNGFGYNLEIDESLVVPDPTKTLKNGAVDPFSKPSLSDWQQDLFRFAEHHGISIGKRYAELSTAQKELLWKGDLENSKKGDFPGILGCFEELKKWKYKLHIRVFIRRYQTQSLCTACKGGRLRPDALAVRLGALNLPETLALSVKDALEYLAEIKLGAALQKATLDLRDQLKRRLEFLDEVGVGYLTLDRPTKTLSGGEFQRISLATQLGHGLCGTLYVLDEPSIGLHAADTDRLIRVLHRLRDHGNTVVVVEHDLEVVRQSDHLIELGPAAGRKGGELVLKAKPSEIEKGTQSLTAKYLSGEMTVLSGTHKPRPPSKRSLRLVGCRENNLKNITVDIPLDRFVVVSGVSGSGKSTLVHKTLYQALSRLYYKEGDQPGAFDRLYGAEQLSGVVLLDQSPIGKSSRSNPATYLKAWDEIRRIYASQILALRRGYTPQHFSFNVDGGRCPVCKGEGEVALDMHFMAEIKLPCEECNGKRFKKTVLEVSYKGKNIDDLLNSTIDEAYELFRDNAILVRKLGILRDVGLGYLNLGQSSTTLSGGESQRLKIAASLDSRDADNLLYVFDEPTTGLHVDDVKRLLGVIQDLVNARHSVVMIEHHLDVIAQADWVIDLGPTGGRTGGRLLAAGPPQDLIRDENSITGQMLQKQGYTFSDRTP